jgi:glycosyl transferase family 2
VAIRFTGVIGADTTLLPYLLDHYAALGVEHFHVIRHADDPGSPGVAEDVEVMRRSGLTFAAVATGPWHMDLNARLIEAEMRKHPGDWWVVADLDEFHVHDRPLAALVKDCEAGGYDYVDGAFVDRVADGGRLVDPAPGGQPSLWEQYPLAGQLTARLLDGRPTKVVLARGHVELDVGQHMAWTGVPAPHDEMFSQVHHFKWDSTVRARLERRVAEYSAGTWEVLFPEVIEESQEFLTHVREHGGTIDVADERFRFARSGPGFADYPFWDEVRPSLDWWYERDGTLRAAR